MRMRLLCWQKRSPSFALLLESKHGRATDLQSWPGKWGGLSLLHVKLAAKLT